MPPCTTMPISPCAPENISFSRYSATYHTARPAHVDLVLLLNIGRGQQADAGIDERRFRQRMVARVGGRLVVLAHEAAVHVARPDAQLQHHRRAARLR